MPNNKVTDPEQEIECPYDKSHMIRAKRFPYHLMKCRKNYTGIDFAVCPFNARHEMARPELKYHIATCPDKHLIEQDIAFEARKNDPEAGTYFKGNTDVPAYDNDWCRPDPLEDWDAEMADVVRIGVDEKILNDPHSYRDLSGLRPCEKKEYKKRLVQIEERKKQGLSYDDLLEDMTGRKARIRKEEEERKKEQDEPTQLRVPKEKPRVLQQQEVLQNKLMMTAGLGRGSGRGIVPVQQMPQPGAATNGGYPTPGTGPQSHAARQQINQNVLLLARGRGQSLGRGQPAPPPTIGLGPSVGPLNPRPDPSLFSMSNSDEDSSSTTSSTSNTSRKLQKKLREIDVLLRRQKLGTDLDADQRAKVAKRNEILEQLERLEIE